MQSGTQCKLFMQGVEELKSIHTLPSLLLYENGSLVHIVEGELFATLHLVQILSVSLSPLCWLQTCRRNDLVRSLPLRYASTCCMSEVCTADVHCAVQIPHIRSLFVELPNF